MGWSDWIELPIDDAGKVDTNALYRVSASAGVYAISTRTGWWSYSHTCKHSLICGHVRSIAWSYRDFIPAHI